jgi:hypothetical protein
MTKRVLVSLTALLAGTGLARAQGCGDGCDIPTIRLPPVQLLRQEIDLQCKESAPVQLPGVKIFRADVAPPKFTDCPPRPPVKYFRCPPPVVQAFICPPPKVELFRAEASCPPPPITCKQPPITLFRANAECPREVPPVRLPSVTVIAQPQPRCPVEIPCPCAGGK